MAGTEICTICHWDELPCYEPGQCPLLKELGFKLMSCLLPSPAPVPLATSPSLSDRLAATDASSVSDSMGLASTPFGLMAAVASVLDLDMDYDSGNHF